MRSSEFTQGTIALGAPNLGAVPRSQLEAMAEAGAEVIEVHRVLAKTGDNVVGEVLRGTGTFYEWDHYPPGDVYDQESHAQFYYHAHPADQRFPEEHGHFHTFLRPRGMPEGVRPVRLPNTPLPDDPNDALAHLIAIAMDGRGLPLRLFTVNRWVTGETWYAAGDVKRMLDRFVVDHTRPSWPANIWVTAMLRFFRPQIEALIDARDRAVADWQETHRPPDVYEDRALEVTAYADIAIDAQMQAIEQALSRAAG
jgi:hypothetical protein